jgi:SM-20-related protein
MTLHPYATPVVTFEEFLAPSELRRLQAFTAAGKSDFRASQVIGPDGQGKDDPSYRRSRVLYNLGEFHGLLGHRLVHFFPHILYRLGLPWFPIAEIEVQLTASNHGEFFRIHADSDEGRLSGRIITFVYFFHRDPARFSGGELRVYGWDPVARTHVTETSHAIRPQQNTIVFFPSDRMHEITPITCPSRAFADSRFTLNGWLHR